MRHPNGHKADGNEYKHAVVDNGMFERFENEYLKAAAEAIDKKVNG